MLDKKTCANSALVTNNFGFYWCQTLDCSGLTESQMLMAVTIIRTIVDFPFGQQHPQGQMLSLAWQQPVFQLFISLFLA
jgi:hypothetical protein